MSVVFVSERLLLSSRISLVIGIMSNDDRNGKRTAPLGEEMVIELRRYVILGEVLRGRFGLAPSSQCEEKSSGIHLGD
jgi:hypothetical protein